MVFGGGAALAAVHLHHRTSEDLDFFSMREIETSTITAIGRSLATPATTVDIETVGPRTSLVLRRKAKNFGRIDFAYYPFDPIGRRTSWRGMVIESLTDMTVNKVQAVMTRFRPRDFVDLWFLLREGPNRDLGKLLELVRLKFDVGAQPMGLASRLLLVREIEELPKMIRHVTIEKLVTFFEERARLLTEPH